MHQHHIFQENSSHRLYSQSKILERMRRSKTILAFFHLEKSFFSSPLYDFYISCELKNRKNSEQSSFCSWSWSFHVMQVAILADNDAGLYYGRALISFCPTTIFSSGNSHFPTAEWFSRILSFSHRFNRMGISYSFFYLLSFFFLLRFYRFCLFVLVSNEKKFPMIVMRKKGSQKPL